MEARTSEYFVTDVGADKACKVLGVVFKHKGRLLASTIHFYSDSFVWFTHDVKTGLCVAASDYYPATDKAIATLDEEIKRFKAIPKEERKHYAAMIKKAYDEAPEVKKQVFGGERNVKT